MVRQAVGGMLASWFRRLPGQSNMQTRKCILILVPMICAASFAQAQAKRNTVDPESGGAREIKRLISKHDEAHRLVGEQDEMEKRKATEFFDRIYAEDQTFTGPDGGVMNREQLMRQLNSGDMFYESNESDDVKVRIYGNSAVAT